MILSHKHRYIFIKSKKTAGSSVQFALEKHCGKEDIFTRIQDDSKRLDKKNLFTQDKMILTSIPI